MIQSRVELAIENNMAPLLAILDQGTGSTAGASQSVTQWFADIATNVVVPEGGWFATGQLQLQLRFAFVATPDPTILTRDTARFYNPTQSQIGHWAASEGGFVIEEGRILYSQQTQKFESSPIQLYNTRQDAPKIYNNTENTTITHSLNQGLVRVCGILDTPPSPPGSPAQGFFSGSIGGGTICTVTVPGQLQLYELDNYEQSVPRELILELNDSGLPDRLTGVVWPGWGLSWAWTLGYLQARSTAQQVTAPGLITGEPRFLPNFVTCVAGVPQPFSGGGQCTEITRVYVPDGNGGGTYDLYCGQLTP